MPSLRIPESYRPALAALNNMSEDARSSLADVFKSAPPFYSQSQLASWLAERFPSLDHMQAANIVQLLISLYSVRIHLNLTIAETVDDLMEAMQDIGDESIKLTKEQIKGFRRDLLELMSIESLAINEKSSNLLNEAERPFHSARVLTDIRSVFGEDAEDGLKAAQIIHTLRLQYYTYDGLKEIFFSLDTADILTLQSVLDRALIKERSLARLLDSAGVSHPDIEMEA